MSSNVNKKKVSLTLLDDGSVIVYVTESIVEPKYFIGQTGLDAKESDYWVLYEITPAGNEMKHCGTLDSCVAKVREAELGA